MSITIPASSRYKDSFSYVTDEGVDAIGPMQLPVEFAKTSESWTVHSVTLSEIGFPDIIAHRYFGQGSENLWWIICLVNGIVDADLDLVPGQRIMIPPRDLVARFVARRTRG